MTIVAPVVHANRWPYAELPMRHGCLSLLLIALLAPLPGRAQERRTSWRIRAEAGPGKVDWWNQAGLFVEAGLSVARTESSALALDLKMLDGRGGDSGGDSEGFIFALIGPELRLLPASRVSPFIAAHAGFGYDQDGEMSALTGELGLDVRTGSRIDLRLTGITDAAADAWGVLFGLVARL